MLNGDLPALVQLVALLVLLVFVLLEWGWAKRRHKSIYNRKETAANGAIFAGMQVSKALLLGWSLFWFELAEGWALFDLEATPALFAVTFLAADLAYYVYHRAMHEVRALWCFHLVHHSSPWMNLTTAGRLNWLSPLVSPFFYLPLVLLGLPGAFIVASMGINLLFQFFMHTEAVGKIPLIQGILNTPSAHRVHHASDARFLDKNYGGVLMIWDRLFGTWAEEEGPITYGVTTGFQGHNPLWLVFGGFVEYARGRLASKG